MSHAFVPTFPQWSPVDDATADLLSVLADDGTVSTDYEWDLYLECLQAVAAMGTRSDGFGFDWTVNPNSLRERIAGRIKPQRVGAFTHRALSLGLVEYTGAYVTSTDRHGRNSGKPARELRWIGENA